MANWARTSRHRGLSRHAQTWHLIAALYGEYGPHVQAHLVGRYVVLGLSSMATGR